MAGALSAILTIAGTVVGAIYGGVPGAYIGSLIGGAVGNLLDPKRVEGPRLGDLTVRASTYGKTIPLVYGRENRIGGNVIWSSGIVEHATEDDGGTLGSLLGAPTTVTYSYTASFAIALGQGVMRNVQAIYANGKLLWTRQDALDRLPAQLAHQNKLASLCSSLGNPPFCSVFTDSIDYLENVDPALELPDFTPWVLWPSVALSSDGVGEVSDRAATLWKGGEFDAMEWFPGTSDQPASMIIPGPTPAYRGTAYIVLRNLQLGRFGNAIPTIEVVVSGLVQETVAEIIGDMADRAGADLGEVVARGAVSYPVRGYAVGNAQNVISAIKPLQIAFPFDACDQDGTLRFVPRRQSPVCTIPVEDMAARPAGEARKPTFPIERIPNYELPTEVALTYVDPANAYQPGTQIATRASGNARTKVSQSVPITMSAGEARAVSDRLLWEAWLSREQIKSVTVSGKYDFIQPGDLIAAANPGGYAAYRVIEKTRGDNGVIELSLVKDDRVAYEGASLGAEPFVFDQTPPLYGPTFPYLFNAPVMAPSEDDSGFSLAMTTAGRDWPRADLYRSTDGTTTWQFATRSENRIRIGHLSDVLDIGPTDIWDRINVIGVSMIYADGPAPASVSEADLLANPMKNLAWVGAADGSIGELIQYATVVNQSDGLYLLSDLLRARRGTEYAMAAHGTDSVVVLIPESSADSLDYGVTDWNASRFYTALSVGETLEDGTLFYEFTANGERLKPRSPVHVTGARDGSNNLTIDWIRRTRLFAPPMGYGVVPLGESSEAYEVDIIVSGDVVRTISVTAPEASYSAAEQTTDSITPGDPVTGKLYQISTTFGRGHAADFTV